MVCHGAGDIVGVVAVLVTWWECLCIWRYIWRHSWGGCGAGDIVGVDVMLVAYWGCLWRWRHSGGGCGVGDIVGWLWCW